MKKKKALLSLMAVGAIISAGIGVNSVLADDTNSYPPIVSRLADKFNLKEDDVAAVFDAVHEEHHDEMMQDREDRLNQAVEDGVITEDQKNALLEKEKEMFENRKENRDQNHDEMMAWFEEQGIDPKALSDYAGMGMRHRDFGGRMSTAN